MPRPHSPTATAWLQQAENTTESLEVTREDHLQTTTTMVGGAQGNAFNHTGFKNNSASYLTRNSSTSSSKGVKTRLSNILRPRHNRGTSVPVPPRTPSSSFNPQPQQGGGGGTSRIRAYSYASAPAAAATATSSPPPPIPLARTFSRQNTPRRRHSNMQSTPQRKPRSRPPTPPPPPDNDNGSLSDNMTVEGLRSVATNQTISSIETVKASNKTTLHMVPEGEATKSDASSKSNWGKAFKRALKPFKMSSSPEINHKNGNSPPSAEKDNRRRIQSFDKASAADSSKLPTPTFSLFPNPVLARSKSSGDKSLRSAQPSTSGGSTSPAYFKSYESLTAFDQSIRGRMDGLDVMALGSALWVNSPVSSTECNLAKPDSPWDDTKYSVTGRPTRYSPADIVKDMLWTSGGRAKPEIILEGFIPGPEDRWSVQIEGMHNPKYAFTYCLENLGPPPLQAMSMDENTTSTATDEHDSPLLSTHKLWTSLWGSGPIPSGQPNRDLLTQVGNKSSSSPFVCSHGNADLDLDDPLLSLAADQSIPIDIDEDTFIVSTRDHMMAIQDIASVPLAEGRFDTALRIMEKLLLGLEPNARAQQRYLRGSTFHNIGLIHLWQGNYMHANSAFAEALKERRKYLGDHTDVVVTQNRHAQSLFALERFDEAIRMLEGCLRLVDENTVARAKILNNLAVVHYHVKDDSKPLRYLAQALQIQREWLDLPNRRDTIVYDASVSLSNMGKLYLARTDFELCSSVYEEALLLQTSIFQKEHPSVIQSYINLAWSKALSGHSRTALRLLESCHRVQTAHFGPDASATVETAGWMAHLYARAGRYKEALPIYLKIREWQKQHLKANTPLFFITGPHTFSHPSMRLVKDAIKRIENLEVPNETSYAWL